MKYLDMVKIVKMIQKGLKFWKYQLKPKEIKLIHYFS